MKKVLITLGLVAFLGALGWQIYQKATASPQGQVGRPRPANLAVAVEVAPVKKGSIQEIGRFTGSLLPSSEFLVAPKISGRLEKLLVQIGDRVEGGQLIAVLDDEEYRQQVSQARAELEVAQANLQERGNMLENAQREYQRTVALRQKKIASESQLDAAESGYKAEQAKQRVATAQVAQKDAALKAAEVRLSYTRIQVPENNVPGPRVVGERFVDQGAMLPPNKPIVSILDIATLRAVIYVIERDYSKIQPGLEAVITTDAFPARIFSGRVLRIAPILKETSREARVEIAVPNPDQLLKPGMFIRARIAFARRDQATVVPVTALLKRDGREGLFLADLEAKRAAFVPVEVGIVTETEAEILSPPLSGSVVTLGQHLLEDGAAIILPGSPAQAGPERPEDDQGKTPRQADGSSGKS